MDMSLYLIYGIGGIGGIGFGNYIMGIKAGVRLIIKTFGLSFIMPLQLFLITFICRCLMSLQRKVEYDADYTSLYCC